MMRVEIDSSDLGRLAAALPGTRNVLRDVRIEGDALRFDVERPGPFNPNLRILLEIHQDGKGALRIVFRSVGFARKALALFGDRILSAVLKDPAALVAERSGGLLRRDSNQGVLLDARALCLERLRLPFALEVERAAIRKGGISLELSVRLPGETAEDATPRLLAEDAAGI